MLCKLVLKTERALLVEPGSVLREPLMKYLVRFPTHTLDYFLEDVTAKDAQFSRFLTNMVDKHAEHGKVFREGALASKADRLSAMIAMGGVITPGTHAKLLQLGISQVGCAGQKPHFFLRKNNWFISSFFPPIFRKTPTNWTRICRILEFMNFFLV